MELRQTAALRRWIIVIAAGLIMGATLGVRHTQGLFMQPVLNDQHWTREAFGFAIAIQNLIWGLSQPFTGMLADRYGSAKVIFAGLLLYALGLLLMSDASSEVGFTLTNGVLIGFALSGTAFGTVYGALSRIFGPAERGWALAVAGAIGGLGQFCMVPAVQALLDDMQWFTVSVVLCVAMVVLSPLAIFLREKATHCDDCTQEQASLWMALRAAFAHKGFWLLNTGFFACGFQLAFIGTHMPAYLLDQGLSVHEAATALACIALANVFGMYCAGISVGMYRIKYVLANAYLIRAVAMLVFISFPVTAAGTYVFAGLMGFLWLGTAPLTNSLVARIFGVRYIATLFGFVFFGHQLGSFLGVWLGGYVYDTYGSYDLLWQCSIAVGLVAALLHIGVNDAPRQESATALRHAA